MKYIKNFFNTNISFFILLIIVVFALYGKAINFGLTALDDDILITKNINLISDYKNIPKLFTMSAFYNNTTTYYRPILSLSFAIESFFVRDNLKLYHLTNIILFVLSLYLFYLFCIELKLNSIITKFILLLIAVHPMFSSVVVWIPGRNDSLLTVFFISSFIFFIKYINSQKIKYAFLFGIFFVLSLFTKETFIFLIPLYFVYLFLYEYNVSKRNLIFIFTSLFPFILLFFILRKMSVVTFEYQYYISNINKAFFYFVKDSFIYFYSFLVPEYIPVILFNATLNLKIILYNCLFTFILVFLLYKKILPKKFFIFSFLFILLSIFPTFLTKENVYLNHRFFLCALGFVMMFVLVLDYLIVKISRLKILFLISFLIFFISLSFISYKHTDKYRNYENFWVSAFFDSPEYHVTCQHLSKIYASIGKFEEAGYYIEKAVKLKSSFSTCIDYANFLIITGNLEEAETALLKIEEDMKGSKDLLYLPLSEIYYKKQDYKKALEYALKAYNIKPYDIDYCKQLLKIYHVIDDYYDELNIYKHLLDFDKRNKEYKKKIMELEEKINNGKMKNV